VVRLADNDNFIVIGFTDGVPGFSIYDVVAGLFILRDINLSFTPTSAVEYSVYILVRPARIDATVDGANPIASASAFNSTETRYGLEVDPFSGNVFFDDFLVVSNLFS